MWRTLYITEANKISLNLNHIQINNNEDQYYVSLAEVGLVILEDYKCLITTRLMIELAEKGIPLLILGLDHLPIGEYQPLNNHSRTTKKYKEQFLWDENRKHKIWKYIIKNKILNQIRTLFILDKPEKLDILKNIENKTKDNDSSNCEGTAARIYFKEMFGIDFIRFSEDLVNISLNFIYHVIRTNICREIIARGYTTTIGINHKSEYNFFNLADDVIEVYRPIADYHIYKLLSKYLFCNENIEFNKELKSDILSIMNKTVRLENKKYTLNNSIPIYLNNIFICINDNKEEIDFSIPLIMDTE